MALKREEADPLRREVAKRRVGGALPPQSGGRKGVGSPVAWAAGVAGGKVLGKQDSEVPSRLRAASLGLIVMTIWDAVNSILADGPHDTVRGKTARAGVFYRKCAHIDDESSMSIRPLTGTKAPRS